MFNLIDGKATVASRKELAKITIPNRKGEVTDRWRGIQHGELADMVIERAEAAGFKVKSDRWAVMQDGAGLVGALGLMPTKDLKFDLPKGTELSLGIRHSNDGRHALTFMSGLKVLVCSNGMIHEVFTPADRRRHTKGVVLSETVDEGLKRFAEGARTGLNITVRAFEGMHLEDDRKVHHLLVESAKRGAVAWSQLGKVEKAWREPPHAEFKPRTGWSLYNAYTEVAKEFSPVCQIDALTGVRELLMDKAKTGFFRN